MSRPPIAARWRVALGGVAAAVLLTLLVGTPQGQTAAAAFLAQFRSQQFAVVPVGPQTQNALMELEHLGTLSGSYTRASRGQPVASLQEASQLVGFPVKQPDLATLPPGTVSPKLSVVPAGELRFTFDQAKARAYYQSIGRTNVTLPDRFDGATLVASIPAGVLLQYNAADGTPALLVGESRELTVAVDGKVSIDELREFLLGLPGLPPETVQQLRSIQDWKSTLPIPVPSEMVNAQQTTVAGAPGVLLTEKSGLFSGVLWQQDGRVFGVAGSAGVPVDVKRVADGLR